MKQAIWMGGIIFLSLIPVQVWGQLQWHVGGTVTLAQALPEQIFSDIAGVNSRRFIHPQYQMIIRMSLNRRFGLESGIGVQYHGARFQYVPDFGPSQNDPRFLVEKSKRALFSTPLLASYETGLFQGLRFRFSAGILSLLNPLPYGKMTIDDQYGGGTDSLLYLRSESWAFLSISANFITRSEFIFPLKDGKQMSLGFLYQKGSQATLLRTNFRYSRAEPVYDQRIAWVNRGGMIGLSLGMMWPLSP